MGKGHLMERHVRQIVLDRQLIKKYGTRGPRYTSYPTADRFIEAFDDKAYRHWLVHRGVGGLNKPVGLYVHIPFCDTACWYCACNRIATRDRTKAARYLGYLDREMAMVSECIGTSGVQQMHWGGGTPTYLTDRQLEELVGRMERRFRFSSGCERSIEIDPRRVGAHTVALLGGLGFNRISIGVQDFDPAVQRAVNRVQSVEQTRDVIDAARAARFRSINLDLIYGLPLQTEAGFSRTLDRVLECSPDRIALYSYAHLPAQFKPQRRINDADLPAPEVKLQLMAMAIQRFSDAGYVHIGMDHFARPEDDLALAQTQGRLVRNFQGYSASGDMDTIGLGVSAISQVGPAHSQNEKTLDEYYHRLESGTLPIARGVELSRDDLVRRAVIQALACHFSVSIEAINIAHLIDFPSYFAEEIRRLAPLIDDGLVEMDSDWISVTPAGRMVVRAVCMVFDCYLRAREEREAAGRVRYSAVV